MGYDQAKKYATKNIIPQSIVSHLNSECGKGRDQRGESVFLAGLRFVDALLFVSKGYSFDNVPQFIKRKFQRALRGI